MQPRLQELDPLDAAYERLRLVNNAIARWDEWLANEALPFDVRHALPEPGRPGRDVLRSLRANVMGVIADLEAQRSQAFRDRQN